MMLVNLLGAIVGGALGYLYYKKVGCATGACPITSNPWVTITYGALMGMVLV